MSEPNELHQVHREMQQLNRKVDRILLTLLGDDDMAQEGLVKKVNRHEQWIQQQKVSWAKLLGVAIGSGIFGGVIMEFLLKVILK